MAHINLGGYLVDRQLVLSNVKTTSNIQVDKVLFTGLLICDCSDTERFSVAAIYTFISYLSENDLLVLVVSTHKGESNCQ